jgi:hypothetical protein
MVCRAVAVLSILVLFLAIATWTALPLAIVPTGFNIDTIPNFEKMANRILIYEKKYYFGCRKFRQLWFLIRGNDSRN